MTDEARRLSEAVDLSAEESCLETGELLPRIPLPCLEDTCERFLAWSAPLLTPDELAETKEAVASFLRRGGLGRRLHELLEQYSNRDDVDSWLDEFWSTRYLGRRDRIALNANFFFLLANSALGQMERAAELTHAAARYRRRHGTNSRTKQSSFLFSTTRIPRPNEDAVQLWQGSRHVVVFRRGNMFRMDVLDENGQVFAADELRGGFRTVVEWVAQQEAQEEAEREAEREVEREAETAPSSTAIGHLTSLPRAEWSAGRRALLGCDPDNAEVLETVESALFCVSLEALTPKDTQEACDALLHGDSGNRWFDKAMSFIVFDDGTAGVNVEHSCLDGVTVLDFLQALSCIPGQPTEEPDQESGDGDQMSASPAVEPIVFTLDNNMRSVIRAAAAKFAVARGDVATAVLSLDDFGRRQAKQIGVSPDAFMQMAYQLAHKRTKGFVGATYESISMRHFRAGRTEAMRVVSPEVVQFVTAMDDPDAGRISRKTTFLAAARVHVERVKECRAGMAPEQHLLALQFIQRKIDAVDVATTPLLFDSPGWLILRDDFLSTSSAGSSDVRYFGFGPTSNRCIGIGYVMQDDSTQLYLSTKRTSVDDLMVFVAKLREAVRELQDLVES